MAEQAFNHAEIHRIFTEAPFIRQLGIEPIATAPGHCESTLVLRPDHQQQDGVTHAGVLATLADHTAGAAAAGLVPAGHRVLTVEFKLNLLRVAAGERLRCVATVLKPGRRWIFAESEVYVTTASGERLVAKASVSLAVIADTPQTADEEDGA